ncbi:MAG: carboxypeptidase regulatory-like domain-containing protein [Egibacteraceae bacterium]
MGTAPAGEQPTIPPEEGGQSPPAGGQPTIPPEEGGQSPLSDEQPTVPPEEGGQGSFPPGSGPVSIPGTSPSQVENIHFSPTEAEGNISSTQAVPDTPVQTKSGISGRITASAGGRPIEGAVIAVTSQDRPPQPTPLIAAVTDREGRYSWSLPPGIWDITASAGGYGSATQRVVIRERSVHHLDFTLE